MYGFLELIADLFGKCVFHSSFERSNIGSGTTSKFLPNSWDKNFEVVCSLTDSDEKSLVNFDIKLTSSFDKKSLATLEA